MAAAAQPFKIDHDFVKTEEKGLSVRGVQRITFANVAATEKEKNEKKQLERDNRLRGISSTNRSGA
ncbi:hypothetical protein ABZ479_32275 [Streptomyces sp. NPDC005722]